MNKIWQMIIRAIQYKRLPTHHPRDDVGEPVIGEHLVKLRGEVRTGLLLFGNLAASVGLGRVVMVCVIDFVAIHLAYRIHEPFSCRVLC